MKKNLLFLALAALTSVGVGAQSIYDATGIAQKDLNGSARFVGMGGAMGALGGDITTIGTNPAGIGIYRSNDVSFTTGYSLTGTESTYNRNSFTNEKARWNISNAGMVLSTKIGNYTSLRYINFGFNYKKSKSFYRNMTMQGMMGSVDGHYISQVRTMADLATASAKYVYQAGQGEILDLGGRDIFRDPDVGWLGALGWGGALLDEDTYTEKYNTYYPIIPAEVDGFFRSRERGGIDQYDFNLAFNVNDRFYFGVTLGVYDVDYHKYALYDEDYGNTEGYALETFKRISGTGYDVKLGTIIRPFEESPLRIGLAVHTPTFYKLTYTNGALLNSAYLDADNTLTVSTVDTYQELGGRDMDMDFELRTPWVFNASLGYTVGNFLALGAEYEYEDYSTMNFKYFDGYDMELENEEADFHLKGVSTLRLGAELKPTSDFALRAGYNYSTAAYKGTAYKYMPTNTIATDTDFNNTKEMHTFTIGLGYRFSSCYLDLAYKLDTHKSDFYAFSNEFGNSVVTPQATKVDNTRSSILLTLGMRF